MIDRCIISTTVAYRTANPSVIRHSHENKSLSSSKDTPAIVNAAEMRASPISPSFDLAEKTLNLTQHVN